MEENTNGVVEETKPTEVVEEKVYTEKELISEVDRRVNQALAKQERKYNEKMKESEKLARMNEQEKFAYQLEQRELAIAEKEKALAIAENKAEASKVLADRGLAVALVDFVVSEDAETMKANIDLLDKAFKASVKAEVEKRMASNTPKRNLPTNEVIDKARFAKMTATELAELKRDNPDIYCSLLS